MQLLWILFSRQGVPPSEAFDPVCKGIIYGVIGKIQFFPGKLDALKRLYTLDSIPLTPQNLKEFKLVKAKDVFWDSRMLCSTWLSMTALLCLNLTLPVFLLQAPLFLFKFPENCQLLKRFSFMSFPLKHSSCISLKSIHVFAIFRNLKIFNRSRTLALCCIYTLTYPV